MLLALLSSVSFGVSQETAVAFIENISCKELSISEEDFEWFVYMLKQHFNMMYRISLIQFNFWKEIIFGGKIDSFWREF